MAAYRLAVVFKRELSALPSPTDGCGGEGEAILVVRQAPPPPLVEEEYRHFVDSGLWDLPSAPLKPLEGDSTAEDVLVEGADACSEKLDLRRFDVRAAIDQLTSQVGLPTANNGHWVYCKLLEEPDFGPGSPVHTLVILGRLKIEVNMRDSGASFTKWISVSRALRLLAEVNPNDDRIGQLVTAVFSSDSPKAVKWEIPLMFHFQEYPLGICILPMRSRTAKPFRTTNLLIVKPATADEDIVRSAFIAHGDALLVDPGCCSEFHEELADIVAALPRKLVVLVTHHHYDHVDGLSIIQKCNPHAILLAHENTMNRIGKDAWSSGYTKISDGDDICIGDEQLRVIFAPGHTDGHVALLHVSTSSLVVGDHCVGQGSAVLDVESGGNMKDYFQTTYRFLDLSPRVIIPMHGRINLWPKRMLCGYLKHRRDRELSILNVIEDGAETLFDIIVRTYSDVDVKLWLPASSNVRLHVDHLASQGKLPKGFSHQRFLRTCRLHFLSRWVWVYLKGYVHPRVQRVSSVKLLGALGFIGLALFYSYVKKTLVYNVTVSARA